MDAIYERCCGLDIHKKTVVACVIVPGAARHVRKEIRTFGTMTDDLLALADWLAAEAVTHVAMESTGVFWKPLFNLLEDRFQLLLVNARDIKQVPGRKTDVASMAEMARGKMRAKRGLLERALAGRMAPHQRFLLTEQLCHIDALDEGIARVSAEIAERMRPFAEALERLDTIPGIGQRMAEILVAEIGIDMSRFPSAAHR